MGKLLLGSQTLGFVSSKWCRVSMAKAKMKYTRSHWACLPGLTGTPFPTSPCPSPGGWGFFRWGEEATEETAAETMDLPPQPFKAPSLLLPVGEALTTMQAVFIWAGRNALGIFTFFPPARENVQGLLTLPGGAWDNDDFRIQTGRHRTTKAYIKFCVLAWAMAYGGLRIPAGASARADLRDCILALGSAGGFIHFYALAWAMAKG